MPAEVLQIGSTVLLGWLITRESGKIIGEIRGIPTGEIPKIEIRSLMIGSPVVEIETKETDQTTYQKMLEVDVPEGFKLSLENISILPITNEAYAKYKFELDDVAIEDKDILATLTLPFRGRCELFNKCAVWIRTTSEANPAKSQVSLVGILMPKEEVKP